MEHKALVAMQELFYRIMVKENVLIKNSQVDSTLLWQGIRFTMVSMIPEKKPSIALLIPCYNCGDSIVQVVNQCRQYSDRILTVNDGSTDDTADHLRSCQTETLGWKTNRGKGTALREGFQHLLAQGDWSAVITLDSDGQHDPNDIPAFVEMFLKTNADIVVGWRDFNAPGIPPLRKRSNVYSTKLISQLTGCSLKDLQCGYRLFSRKGIETLLPAMQATRYAVETEMVLLAQKHGLTIMEMPIRCIYTTASSRASSWRPLLDSWHITKTVVKFMFR